MKKAFRLLRSTSPILQRAMAALTFLLFLITISLSLSSPALSQQKIHEEYTKKMREATTDPHFTTKYVNYLPYASGIPTPLEVLGRIAGAPNVLSYSHEIYKYMRELAKASPCVDVFTVGQTEEGRDWIVVVIADEQTIKNLDKYKQINAKLADPRKIKEEEAAELINQAKPIYWATGGLHSGETGAPEMLIELAYRLAVDESPFIKAIRENAIVLITPILDPDGRDKYVDIAMARRKDPKANYPTRLIYWGKYVAHDNNRDFIAQALALTRHTTKVFFDFHPQVFHDLHESISHLYVSTGTGPYNAWLDPIVVDEWHILAYQEVNELTKLGVPGVWTHGFYDGWAPNYLFYVANGHNAIGRFYETQGAGDGSTRVITASETRDWYRPNPPLRQTLWSIRNNVNLQQSAILVAMNYVATHKEKFMENFYLKSKRAVAKAYNEGPAAYVFPADEPRPGQQARLLRLLQQQGVEIHQVTKAFKIKDKEYPAGSYIVRMDQPYSRMADMLLDRQYFNVNDPRPYDDIGWTLGPLFNIKTERIEDVSILSVPMNLIQGEVKSPGGITRLGPGQAQVYIINHNADNQLATFRFALKDVKMHIAEKAFEVSGRKFNPGSFIIKAAENASDIGNKLETAAKEYGINIFASATLPNVPSHESVLPRIALMHTWQDTQTEGWIRIALDELKIPYDYISVHTVRDTARLKDKWDVIIFGPTRGGDALSILQGVTGDRPIPWKKTDLTPNIGVQDSTDDIRGGLELEGILHLRNFLKEGGVFITIAGSCSLPTHFGLAQGVSIRQTQNLWARGGVFKAEIADKSSPLVYGYDDTLGVYFNQSPVLAVGGFGGRGFGMAGAPFGQQPTGRPSGRGGVNDPDIPQGRPRDLGQKTIEEFRKKQQQQPAEARGEEFPFGMGMPRVRAKAIINFARNVNELLISGGLNNGEELVGTPALVDAPYEKGHVILFAINPMWRHITHGSFFLVFNTLLNWNHL